MTMSKQERLNYRSKRKGWPKRIIFCRKCMQALTKLDVCSATLWINWCLKDWCADFCCHCMRLIDSELCLDDYVKTRKIKLSLQEERMAKKKCRVLYEHTIVGDFLF